MVRPRVDLSGPVYNCPVTRALTNTQLRIVVPKKPVVPAFSAKSAPTCLA